MRQVARRLLIAILALAAIGLGLQGVLQRSAMIEREREAQATASTLSDNLRAEIEKFELVTLTLATDVQVSDLASGQGGGELATTLNRRLDALRGQLGASVIYVINAQGTTLVASNWQQSDSFVGQNYAFRDYFRQAMSLGNARQYALGTRSRIPGLYLAQRITRNGKNIGVVVVKIQLQALEKSWQTYQGWIYVSDKDGVILLTSRDDARFWTTAPVSPERRRELQRRLDFGSAPLELYRNYEYERNVDGLSPAGSGLVLHVLLPTAKERWQAAFYAWLAAAFLVSVAFAVFLWSRWRRHVIETATQAESARRIQLLKDELTQAGKLAVLGQITAGVAHEINQPLTAIALNASSGRMVAEKEGSETLRVAFERIGDMADRMSRITDELRQFSRRSSRGIGPTRLADAIDGTILLLSDRLSRAETQIVRHPEAESVAVAADRQGIEQILVNLVQNSLDAAEQTGTGGPISLRVTTDSGAGANNASFAHIEIADSGPGIDPSVAERLFQPFITTKDSGLGLGLVISQQIARDLGGDLVFVPPQASAPAGTTFLLSLPLAPQ